jgi:radical SAM superfamily enzyme YgiQ (UPF0313 family)
MPVGLACVAEATRRAGHEVALVDLMAETDTEESIRRFTEALKPHMIGISVRNVDDQNMQDPRFLLDQVRDVVSSCKRFSSVPVVLGGAGYSMFPESALEYLSADMGIRGEGEACFPALLDYLEHRRPLSGLPGLYLRGHGLQGQRRFSKDLDGFHLPDMDLLSTAAYEGEDFWVPVQTRRGCPMRCSYCSTETIEGRLIRKRSPEDVVRWLAKCVEAGFRRFHFVDNTFNLPPSYARSLCTTLAEASLNIEWRCILYPGNVDEALVKEMARAGCREASLGFESGCERILKGMNKRFNTESIRRASRMLADYGIRRMGFLLLGGPGESENSVEESLRFVDSLDLEATKITVGIRIYPHTKLAKIASEEGVVEKEDDLFFPRFYMVRDLQDWLKKRVEDWMRDHPNWMM